MRRLFTVRAACGRWRLAPAAVLVLAIAFAGPPLRADWQVRRQGTGALLEHALEALLASPDRPALAAQIVRLAGPKGLDGALEKLRRAASRTPGRHEPRQAYAQLLLAAGRDAAAAETFAAALALRPGSAAAAAGRARALGKAGRAQEAFAAFDEALAFDLAAAGRETLLRELVSVAVKAGALDREIAARRELHALHPRDVREAQGLAEALGRAGRPADGAAVLETCPDGARRAGLLAEAAALREAAGDDAAAERLLRQALAAARAASERAEIYARLTQVGRRQDTLLALQSLIEREVAGPRRAGVTDWEALANVKEELADLEGALQAARRAAALDRSNLAFRRRTLVLLDRLGRKEDVAAAYEDIARRWPDDSALAIERIERKLRAGDRGQARALFDRALLTFRRDGDAAVKLADLASRWSEDDRVLAAWDAVLRLRPADERAIVGLGEAHFQRGRRELARRTWRGLLAAVRPPAEAHARLAELLGEHDLYDEAVPEALAAQKLEPENPHHHRTLAWIFDRKKDHAAALAEWRTALAKSHKPEHAALRREARSSLIGILARDVRGRLDLESVRVAEQLARQPDDRETTLFLAEIELRRLDPDRALATLRAAARKWPEDPEIVGTLVRLLRQSRQLGEAVALLEGLAAKVPARARDTYVQIAEIELGRYSDERALELADRAAALADGDGDALARIGEIQERAGRADRAIATYRRALGQHGDHAGRAKPAPPSNNLGKAAAALQRLLLREGAADKAWEALRPFLRATSDEEARAEVLHKEIALADILGTLPKIERELVATPGQQVASRRVAVAFLARAVPALYLAPPEARPADAHARLARWGLRPLVALLTAAEGEPDPALVALLGMLGSRNATPVLLQIAQPAETRPRSAAASSTAQVAALIALARLADPRAAQVLATVARSPDAGVRAVALWALGRTRGTGSVELIEQAATADPRADVAAVACLSLGHLRVPRLAAVLRGIAGDQGRPTRVRRAAVLALGLADDAEAVPLLLPLLDGPHRPLAAAAAAAVGATRDRRALPGLWKRALLGHGPQVEVALAALRAFATPRTMPDEARAVRDARFDVDLLLDALSAAPEGPSAALETLWVEHAAEVRDVLAHALAGTPEMRRRALAVVDGRADGLALGPLAGDAAPSQRAITALAALGAELRDLVAENLDDADVDGRRLALRVASKLGGGRVGLSHILAVVQAAPSAALDDAESAALLAARVQLESGRVSEADLAASLRPLLADPLWQRRLVGVRLLRLAARSAAPDLERALSDSNPFLRAEAAHALAGSPRSAALLERATRDPVAAVRAAATRSLALKKEP